MLRISQQTVSLRVIVYTKTNEKGIGKEDTTINCGPTVYTLEAIHHSRAWTPNTTRAGQVLTLLGVSIVVAASA